MKADTSTYQAPTVEPAEIERMLPEEVAAQRMTFADVLARRRGDTRPGLLFEDQRYT